MVLKYTTELAFNKFIRAVGKIPDVSVSTSKEEVGTGDGSTTIFYLNKQNIINDTESLYTGSTSESGATTLLVKDTDYTIVNDDGKITLTASGISSVGSTSIFALYNYNKFDIEDSLINDTLERAESELDSMTNTVFFNGTATTPNTGQVTNELHEGKGVYNKVYQFDYAPVYNLTTLASGSISSGATTITVDSTDGFPSSGVFAIESDKISYTGKTTDTFTGCTGVSSSHSDNTTVTSFVIERALDDEGNSPNWQVMQPDTDYSIDTQAGDVKLNATTISGTVVIDNFSPPRYVWDRVRLSYLYGYDTIPSEIVRCVHLIAARELFYGSVLNALGRGTDGFKTDSIRDVDSQIDKTINKYKMWLIKDTKP